jgi:beta-galactosidase/beta-glucuronidase
LSGVGRSLAPNQALWYKRTFEAPSLRQNERVLLHFGAVDWHTTVEVNGQIVGEHKGGYDPFTFDITPFLTRGGPQTLVLKVLDATGVYPDHGC